MQAEIESLEIEWKCKCGPHNCLVLKRGATIVQAELIFAALKRQAICGEEPNATYFVREEGSDQQRALNSSSVPFFLSQLSSNEVEFVN